MVERDELPFIVADRGTGGALLRVGQIVKNLKRLVARHEILLATDDLLQPSLGMLDDVGDLAEHVLVRSIGQRQIAKVFDRLFPYDPRCRSE